MANTYICFKDVNFHPERAMQINLELFTCVILWFLLCIEGVPILLKNLLNVAMDSQTVFKSKTFLNTSINLFEERGYILFCLCFCVIFLFVLCLFVGFFC